RLAALRSWAQPLQLPRGKVSYHLLESRNVAAAILDFARSNHVYHIVIGAPMLGSYAGRVVAQVTSEAPCGVTVVRAPGDSGDAGKAGRPPPDQVQPDPLGQKIETVKKTVSFHSRCGVGGWRWL